MYVNDLSVIPELNQLKNTFSPEFTFAIFQYIL